jgi:hypothetical protein
VRPAAAIGAFLVLAPVASAAKPPNPCSLLTNAEVAKATGSKVVSVTNTRTSDNYYRVCAWKGQNLAKSGSVSMPVQRVVSVFLRKTTHAQFLSLAESEPGATPIHGVCDVAFVTRQGEGGFFNCYARGYSILMTISFVTNDIPVEKTLARDAAARL